jgi:hypothetical protein
MLNWLSSPAARASETLNWNAELGCRDDELVMVCLHWFWFSIIYRHQGCLLQQPGLQKCWMEMLNW